jgi:hypothetical protein
MYTAGVHTLVSKRLGTEQWGWQWTATFAVMTGVGVGGVLWTRGFRAIASVVTVVATLLGMYVAYRG